ncbi:MAG: hypothetical protein GWP05_00555 [Anaerolineaceae bacterium]|nr:hypothetical protein [Anaerolineaceae bacterium]
MGKRKPWLLAAAAMAAVVMLTAIMYGPLLSGGPAARAAGSPVGRMAIVLIVVCSAILGGIALALRRLTDRPHPPMHRVWRDEGGTAALEMLLALPFIVMILLVVLQSALLWNANMVIHHAGFAVARAAVTIVRSNVEESGEEPRVVFNDGADYSGYPYSYPPPPPSLKMWRIRRAAVLALLPISGEVPTTDIRDPELSGSDVADAVLNALTVGEGDVDQAWIRRIEKQFAYADHYTEVDLRRPLHWTYEEPRRGENCPRRSWRRTDWNPMQQSQYDGVPLCRNIPGQMDFHRWEEMQVKLNYKYPLLVPYANRILAKLGMAEKDTSAPGGKTFYVTELEIYTPYRRDHQQEDADRYKP